MDILRKITCAALFITPVSALAQNAVPVTVDSFARAESDLSEQIDTRYIEPGQPVELTFKFLPARIFAGKVVAVLQAISTGQVQASGLAATPQKVTAAPFVVRVRLDDDAVARTLPAGSAGTAAVYTDHVKPAQIIRKVLLRQSAILNYINPF